MARQDYYSQNLIAVVIDGVAVQDFAEGSCLSIDAGGDQASMNKGADGAKTSISFDKTATVTVRLKPTSSSNDQFAGIMAKQQGGTFPDISVAVQAGSGETHNGTGGSLLTIAPVASGSNEMEQREWVFQFQEFTFDAG